MNCIRWCVYIYSLEPGKGGPSLTRALAGETTPPADPDITSCVLDASFTDAGFENVPPIVGQASVTLRSSRIQAENSPEIKGSMVLSWANAGGKKGVGSIGHQHHVKLADIPLDQCRSITCHVASAGTGGNIEIHAGKPDGELLATLEVKPTGAWDTWVDVKAALPAGKSRTDVYLVFIKPGVGGGMMNLDWAEFEPGQP